MASDALDDHHGPSEEVPAPPADKLLVVDDESGIRKGCERVLRARGHEVFLAETAERVAARGGRPADFGLYRGLTAEEILKGWWGEG